MQKVRIYVVPKQIKYFYFLLFFSKNRVKHLSLHVSGICWIILTAKSQQGLCYIIDSPIATIGAQEVVDMILQVLTRYLLAGTPDNRLQETSKAKIFTICLHDMKYLPIAFLMLHTILRTTIIIFLPISSAIRLKQHLHKSYRSTSRRRCKTPRDKPYFVATSGRTVLFSY